MDSHSSRGSKEDFDGVVVRLGDAAEEFVWSQEDRLDFVELSVFGKAGGRYLDQVSYLVLRRGTAAFVGLLRLSNTAANELCLD